MKKYILLSAVIAISSVANLARAEKVCFEVHGMTCATCSVTLKSAVKKLKGIQDISASIEAKSAEVDFDSSQTNANAIKKAIDDVGYKAQPQNCNKKG